MLVIDATGEAAGKASAMCVKEKKALDLLTLSDIEKIRIV